MKIDDIRQRLRDYPEGYRRLEKATGIRQSSPVPVRTGTAEFDGK